MVRSVLWLDVRDQRHKKRHANPCPKITPAQRSSGALHKVLLYNAEAGGEHSLSDTHNLAGV